MELSSRSPRNRAEMAACIEAADLRPTCTHLDVTRLVNTAVRLGLRGVCVPSCHVDFAAELRGSSALLIVSVVGFPMGTNFTHAKVAEASAAVGQGADELDVVMNLGWFVGGLRQKCLEDLADVVRAVQPAPVKAILEVGYLSDDQIADLCRLAVDAGATMLKTSTGFGPVGARPDKIELMRKAVGPQIPIKAAGGIRTWTQALELIEAGANLLGTSDPQGILAGGPNDGVLS
jgi:deoxyribose-phosphate aldolase